MIESYSSWEIEYRPFRPTDTCAVGKLDYILTDCVAAYRKCWLLMTGMFYGINPHYLTIASTKTANQQFQPIQTRYDENSTMTPEMEMSP